jgi:hypothetical protein
MTTPDIAGLCERLDGAYERQTHIYDWETIILTKATLERQASEIERLREALAFYADRKLYRGNDTRWTAAGDDEGRKARAALTGEDTAGSPTSQNTEPGLTFSDAGEP